MDTASSKISYAAVADYKEGVNQEHGIGIVRDKKKKTIRTFFTNMPIFNLYLYCFYNSGKANDLIKPSSIVDPNQIDWKVSDKSRFQYFSKAELGYKQDWLRENGICFESLSPDKGQADGIIYQDVIDELNRLLGLRVYWDRRKEKVLVLVRTNGGRQWKSKLGANKASQPQLSIKGNLHQFRQDYLTTIVYQMNQIAGNPYVFDETGIKESVDLNLNFSSWKDISGIRRSLKAYGLDLKEEVRTVDKLKFAEASSKEGGVLLIDPKMQTKALSRKAAQIGLKEPESEMNRKFLQANKMKTGVVVLPSGLQYKIIKKGNGPIPTENDIVQVNYTGMLINGKIFESSMQNGRATAFKVTDVIEGWTEALQLMPVGSKWILYIPAKMAYGSATNSGRIPANSVLVFELELIQIEK